MKKSVMGSQAERKEVRETAKKGKQVEKRREWESATRANETKEQWE